MLLTSVGKVDSSTLTVASPTGMSVAVHVPSDPVVTVTGLLFTSVIITSTPAIPSSPGS
nr:hypothetical protein [Lacinutrix himadriensis]